MGRREEQKWDQQDLPFLRAKTVFTWKEALGAPAACSGGGEASGQASWDSPVFPSKLWYRQAAISSQGPAPSVIKVQGHKVASTPFPQG